MIARFNGNVVPFADDSTSTNRTVFGGVTQSDAIDDNLNADFKKGWEIVGLNDNPTREDFNAMGYTLGALISYLYEMGISEWNTSQNYRVNSRVIGSDGKIYKAKTGTDLAPNVNNNPTTDITNTNWDVDTQFDINSLVAKTTPIDSDNLAIQETGGLFKKLSWANLKANLFDGAMSLTTNGYIKLPSIMGGIMLQWGSTLFNFIGAGTISNTVTFPIAFTVQAYAVLPSLISNTPQNFNTSYGTGALTSFMFYCSSTGSSGTLANTWFAIGR